MELKRVSGVALVLVAGTTMGAWADGPSTDGDARDRAEVMATFDDRGATDHAGMGKADLERSRPAAGEEQPEAVDAAWHAAKLAAMDAELAEVFAKAPAKSAASVPNYRYLRGVAVPMHLDPMRVVVKAGGEGTARLAAAKAGLVVAEAGHRTVNGYTMLALVQPLGGLNEANATIERLIAAGGVEFAGPVFANPFIEGGFYFPTLESLVQVAEGLDALAVARAEAKEFRVTDPALGGMPGALELTSTERNGFRVMAATNRLAESPSFRWAHPAAIQSLVRHAYEPTDPSWSLSWGHRNTGGSYNGLVGVADRDMDTDQAWDLQRGTASTITLVMDDGCQTNHPDLNWLDGRDFTTGAANGTGDGSHSTSCERHGTSVAGCVAERIDNGLGSVGTAPDSRVIVAKIADIDGGTCSNSFDAYSPTWVVNALNWGRNYGARVSNASFGVGQDDAIEAMYTNTYLSGVVHFASAGNGGSDGVGDPNVGFPSSAPNVISVAALQPNGTLTSFSNYGNGLDLCAPGTAVYSTDRTGSGGYTSGDYVWFGGTSAASPVAAGVAALFFSQHPFATASQCVSAIFNSCDDLGAAGTDFTYARGFINAFGALTYFSPNNDTCSGATVIGSNSYNPAAVDVKWSTGSLLEADEDCGWSFNNNSVFYRFTAPNTGVVNINTNGSDYDTVLSVFGGCVLFFNGIRFEPSELACDDDGGTGLQSQITNLPVTAGQTITIKVAKYGTASGGGLLDFNFGFTPVAPPNDSCSTPTEIVDPGTGAFTYTPALLDTDFATTVTCEPDEDCGATTNSNSVYYRFAPAHPGTISIDTFGSDYDTVLSIFHGCAISFNGTCIQPYEVGCNDDSSAGLQSSLNNIPVTTGQTYLIKVADYGSEGGGLLDLNFAYNPPPPINDECTNARVIPPLAGLYDPAPVDVFNSSTSACENTHSCVETTSH